MHPKPIWILFVLVVVVGIGQAQTQQVHEQLVRMSTTCSTELLTITTTETMPVTRTTVLTVAMPKLPELTDFAWTTKWYNRETKYLTKVAMTGNLANRAEVAWGNIRLKFEMGTGWEVFETFYYNVPAMRAGETLSLEFSYTPRGQYRYDWTWIQYRGIDQYTSTIPVTTFLQTTATVRSRVAVKTTTVTTAHTILLQYTEFKSASQPALPWLMIVIVPVAAVAAALILRKTSAGRGSEPTKTAQPQMTIGQRVVGGY